MRLESDGMLGAVIASESLGLTDTMINGAGGCRSRTQIMMHELIPEYLPENRSCCRSKYFSRQSRIPCTYLNNDDIVFGTMSKVSEGIESVSSITGRRTILLDTLGASLLCTDYAGLTGDEKKDPIVIKDDLSSMSLAEGYDTAMCAILESIDIQSGSDGSVNILGYGIMDLGWSSGAQEICDLLEAMGVKVNCILGCMPDKENVLGIGRASLNIMIHPEYCRRTADMLERRFGTASLRPDEGAPVGYPSLRSFVKQVATALDVDPTAALNIIDSEASAVHSILYNYDRIPTGLHSKGFSVKGDSSVAYPLIKWMMETFSMVPRRIVVTDEEYLPEITEYLEQYGLSEALDGAYGEIDIEFTDGLTALEGRLSVGRTGFVEICIPHGRALDLMGRTLVGTKGCRYILDEMMNSRIQFRCGQPTEIEFRKE